MLSAELQDHARRHVLALAEQHDIEVHFTKTWASSEVDVATRQVFVPKRLRLGTDYLAALHEIGHVVDPGAIRNSRAYYAGPGRKREKRYHLMIEEATAWAWAIRHALPSVVEGFTPQDWARVGKCWLTYVVPA